jgi:hypothetical protein
VLVSWVSDPLLSIVACYFFKVMIDYYYYSGVMQWVC